MSKDTSDSDSQESPDSEAPTPPLEVKVTNKESKWNDSRDDIEYEEIILSDEDKDI